MTSSPDPADASTRPGWDLYFLDIARMVAARADCRRARHGCVIVGADRRIVATGYNGSPSGGASCLAGECPRGLIPRDELASLSPDYSNCIALHAEQNAVAYASRAETVGATAYITGAPCDMCSKLLAAAGIVRVVTPLDVVAPPPEPPRPEPARLATLEERYPVGSRWEGTVRGSGRLVVRRVIEHCDDGSLRTEREDLSGGTYRWYPDGHDRARFATFRRLPDPPAPVPSEPPEPPAEPRRMAANPLGLGYHREEHGEVGACAWTEFACVPCAAPESPVACPTCEGSRSVGEPGYTYMGVPEPGSYEACPDCMDEHGIPTGVAPESPVPAPARLADLNYDEWKAETRAIRVWAANGAVNTDQLAAELRRWADYYDTTNHATVPTPAPPEPSGVALIATERARQINVEGYTPEHDDGHPYEMARAAACYLRVGARLPMMVYPPPDEWPWEAAAWKPAEDDTTEADVRNLVKAGALIAAEIDRLQRVAALGEGER